MSLTPITDYVEQAIARLAAQYKGMPLIEGLVEAIIQPFQGIEDALVQTLNFRWVDTAIGAQLDGLGSIVGEERRGRNDDEYRLAIKLRIAINTSQGTPENAINVFLLVTGCTQAHYLPYYPAEVDIFGNCNFAEAILGDASDDFAFDGGPDGLGFGDFFDSSVGGEFQTIQTGYLDFMFNIIQSVLPGGVLLGHIGYYDEENAFIFEGNSPGGGFGDVFDSTMGGQFATILL